jgi:hypothetical protein
VPLELARVRAGGLDVVVEDAPEQVMCSTGRSGDERAPCSRI